MERIEYTAAQKKKLFTFEWAGRGDTVSGLRAVKMARPICDQGCQNGLDTLFKWWETCKHGPQEKDGSPYWRMRQHVKKVDNYEPVLDSEGNPTGEYTGSKVARVFFKLEPNITEVVYDIGIGSGANPEQFKTFKGFAALPDVGVAPMCELKGCGKAWPTIRVAEYTDRAGDKVFRFAAASYCSEAHARLAGARIQSVFLPTNDAAGRAQALQDEVRI